MLYTDKQTPVDKEVNVTLKNVGGKEECITFVHETYNVLKSRINELDYKERSNQTLLFKSFHSLVTSTKFRDDCHKLFNNSLHSALIGLKVATEVRKYIQGEMYFSGNYKSTLFHKVDYSTENESSVRAQTRYIAGWVISSKKKELITKIRKCSNVNQNRQRQLELQLLETLSRSEGQLDMECKDPESRRVIQMRQNERNGLTNVSDKMFQFVNTGICSARNIYTLDEVNFHKGNAYGRAFEKLKNASNLFQIFAKNFSEVPTTLHSESFGDSDYAIVGNLLDDIKDVATTSISLYEAILHKILHMVHAGNRRAYLDRVRHKKVAHRMQVMMSKPTKSKKSVRIVKRKGGKQKKQNSKRKRLTRNVNDDVDDDDVDDDEEADDDVDDDAVVEMDDVESVQNQDMEIDQDMRDEGDGSEDDLEDNEDCYECGLHDSGRAEDSWIYCDRCNLWYHQECTGYSQSYLKVYIENEGRRWVCRYCARN